MHCGAVVVLGGGGKERAGWPGRFDVGYFSVLFAMYLRMSESVLAVCRAIYNYLPIWRSLLACVCVVLYTSMHKPLPYAVSGR